VSVRLKELGLERELVQECREVAQAMGAYLLEVGQRRAKGSGTTVGCPDLLLICSGHVELIEVKREKVPGTPGGVPNTAQVAVALRCAGQGVNVHFIDTVEEFVSIVNACRR
jgi:hypothetical protein